MDVCKKQEPLLQEQSDKNHLVACHLY
jgi:hypothetical protein